MSDDDEIGIRSSQRRLFQRSHDRAYTCLSEQQYQRAFAHFLVALTLNRDVEDSFLESFFYTLEKVVSELENAQNWTELLKVYEHALDVLPINSHILHGLASLLFRLGHIESATRYFQKAYRENPFFTPSLYCADNLKNSLVERWHFSMMNDESRNLAYQKAINRAIKDEKYSTVLDIGAGTGILSMMAVDAGAEHVYACEGNQVMYGILQKVIEANAKNIKPFSKFSYDIKIPGDLPERASLVVTEIFDAGLFGENVLSTLKHAWGNLIITSNGTEEGASDDNSNENIPDKIKIRGKIIPHSATVYVAPLECEKIRNNYWVSSQVLKAFDLEEICLTAGANFEEPYTTEKLSTIPGGYRFLSSPHVLLSVNFNDIDDITSLLAGKSLLSKFEVETSGRLDAFAVWFELHLDSCTSLCTGPENEDSCWEQSIFCVLPKHLRGGSSSLETNDQIEVTFVCKGHLTLEQVKTASSSDVELDKFKTIDSFSVQSLNSFCTSNILNLNLYSKVFGPDRPLVDTSHCVIDTSSFPCLGFKALKDGAHKLIVLPTQHLGSIYELKNLCGFTTKEIRSFSYEDLCVQNVKCPMIICEPVEMCGLLKKNIFEDIALLRTLNQNESPQVFPKKITIFARLIDSSNLFSQAKVTSDVHCLGYKISEYLNMYQSVIQQDLQLSTLSHNKLCDDIEICDIDLNQLFLEKQKLQSFVEFRGTKCIKIKTSGNVTALPFWFSLHYDEHVFSTLCAKTSWKQAAIVPETPIPVAENEDVTLEWSCRNSCLNIILKKEQ